MLLVFLAAASLAACARSHGPEPDSETHFLEACDTICPEELECLCGVCTLSCEDDVECSGLALAARCDAPVTTDGRQCAPTDLAPGICQVEPLAPRCGGVWPGAFVTEADPLDTLAGYEGADVYPLDALAGYERVEGALVLHDTGETDLRLLSCLKSARSLTIRYNDELETLEGLENLTLTQTHVDIYGNSELRDISALARIGVEGVQEVTGQINIGSDVPESLEGLQGLRHVADVNIELSPVESLDGLRGLESVAGTLSVSGCTGLTTLDLPGLLELGFLNVQGNPILRGGTERASCRRRMHRPRTGSDATASLSPITAAGSSTAQPPRCASCRASPKWLRG
jgi:hypothetical protein